MKYQISINASLQRDAWQSRLLLEEKRNRLRYKEKRLPRLNAYAFRLAMTKNDEGTSFLAMTILPLSLRASLTGGVAISF
jgi:hypothetical protein